MTESTFKWPEPCRAAASLSFDDARISQVEIGLPILNSHQIRASFYVTIETMDKRLEDWKKAVLDGHEIGNHSLYHPCSANLGFARDHALEEYTLEQMETELVEASRQLEERFGLPITTFAYPCGQTFVGRGQGVKSYAPVVDRLFTAGRGYKNEYVTNPRVCDLAQIGGVNFDSKSFMYLKGWVDRAIDEQGWVIFAGHDVGDEARQTVLADVLDELCAYLKQEGLWVDTVATIADYIQSDRNGSNAAVDV